MSNVNPLIASTDVVWDLLWMILTIPIILFALAAIDGFVHLVGRQLGFFKDTDPEPDLGRPERDPFSGMLLVLIALLLMVSIGILLVR